MIGREYVPGVRHVLLDSLNQHLGPLPWEAGDVYLSRIEAYHSRVSGLRTLDEIKASAKMDIDMAADMARRRYATAVAFQELAYLLKAHAGRSGDPRHTQRLAGHQAPPERAPARCRKAPRWACGG